MALPVVPSIGRGVVTGMITASARTFVGSSNTRRVASSFSSSRHLSFIYPTRLTYRRISLGTYTDARRYKSTTSQNQKELSASLKESYNRLRPVINSFEAPIDWAVAYGSGVMKQAQSSPGQPQPLIDFLISTPSPEEFHSINIRQNPTHYPFYARLFGSSFVSSVQRRGAGVWYVTMVQVNGMSIKYGVISTSDLEQDLKEWTTFYLSGRLHKPTLTLLLPSSSDHPLNTALESNSLSALRTSVLLLPKEKEIEEDELWEKIAGLSYSGDPRMKVPGAENPNKVKNIVRGDGAREGFRKMYTPFFESVGITFQDGTDGKLNIFQLSNDQHRAQITSELPITLRKGLSTRIPQLVQATGIVDEKNDQAWIAAVENPQFPLILSEELQKIIGPPALRQSIKGLFTAGLTKSFWYSLEKANKWFKGRTK